MKKIFIYFILLSSVLLLTFCSENVEEKIETNDPDFDIAKLILDWYPNANHAGLYSAVKDDHFMENKINIIIDTPSDPATILSLVSNQDSDFGIFYQPDLLLARSQGVPVIAVASIVNEPLNAHLVKIITFDFFKVKIFYQITCMQWTSTTKTQKSKFSWI